MIFAFRLSALDGSGFGRCFFLSYLVKYFTRELLSFVAIVKKAKTIATCYFPQHAQAITWAGSLKPAAVVVGCKYKAPWENKTARVRALFLSVLCLNLR